MLCLGSTSGRLARLDAPMDARGGGGALLSLANYDSIGHGTVIVLLCLALHSTVVIVIVLPIAIRFALWIILL